MPPYIYIYIKKKKKKNQRDLHGKSNKSKSKTQIKHNQRDRHSKKHNQIKQTHIPNQTNPKAKPTIAGQLREIRWWEVPMTWWMAWHAQRCGVAWHGDQAMGCCGCGGSGSCGCVGGRRSESVGQVRVAWRGLMLWPGFRRRGKQWCGVEREQRNEVRERADTIRWRNEQTEGRKRRWGDRGSGSSKNKKVI